MAPVRRAPLLFSIAPLLFSIAPLLFLHGCKLSDQLDDLLNEVGYPVGLHGSNMPAVMCWNAPVGLLKHKQNKQQTKQNNNTRKNKQPTQQINAGGHGFEWIDSC